MFKFVIIVLLCSLATVTLQDEASSVAEDDAVLETLINGIGNFSDKLARTFYVNADKKNFIFSPLSVYAVLASLLPGTGSSTRQELADVLGFPVDDKLFNAAHRNLGMFFSSMEVKEIAEQFLAKENGGMERVNVTIEELNFANGIFVDEQYALKQSFLEVQKHYRGKVESVNFAKDPKSATDTINKWVADKTHHRIPNVYESPLDSNTVLVLANCLYFRAVWEKDLFQTAFISSLPFHTPQGIEQVELMQNTDVIPYYDNGESYQVAQFPYKGGDFSMVIVLPYRNTTLENVLSSFSFSKFRETSQKFKKVAVAFKVPRLRFKLNKKIIKDLRAVNITQLFSAPDFRPMIEATKGLEVSDVTHAVDFSMDEKGTEATAVTVISIVGISFVPPPRNPIPFEVTRPYMLFIKHNKSDVPLFSGVIYNPKSQ